MKLFLLSASNSVHTQRWVNGLIENGIEVYLASIHEKMDGYNEKLKYFQLPIKPPFGYFLCHLQVLKLIKKIKPDIVNVHYATGYGLLGVFHYGLPSVLSVWGSDIYKFPQKSVFHKLLLKYILRKYTVIASTSECMKKKTAEFILNGDIVVTPFGIDESLFRKLNNNNKNRNEIVIGTVKSLSNNYGIDILIKSFSRLVKNMSLAESIKLEIVGDGPDKEELCSLVNKLGIEQNVTFFGSVPHSSVPEYLNRFDIYVALSRFESFGVAILEASACELPVVVSDAEGPKEVTLHEETGFIVSIEDSAAATAQLQKLVENSDLRFKLGEQGRNHVLKNYTWQKSLETMINLYKNTINK